MYAGFGDDDKSFYSVYSDLFKRVRRSSRGSARWTSCWRRTSGACELIARVNYCFQIDELDLASAPSSTQPAPAFGGKRASLEEVNRFYQHWANYLTPRSFAWVDEYRTTDAPSRQIRRAMEKENKKLRDAAKKAFTTEVRKLVDFVCRRDQRVLALQKQREKDKAKQQREDAAKKQARQAAFEAEREAFQQQERARWEALETTNQTSKLAQDHIDDELEKMRAKMDAALLLCDLCRKTFRSPKQLQNHLSSKKHKDMELELGIVSSDFASLEAELELELQAELAAAARKTSPNDVVTVDGVSETAVFDDDAADEAAVEDPVELEQRAKAAEAARVAEEARVLKEQKAADKRKERKEQRKQAKKEGVEKLVTGGETTRSSKGQAGAGTGGGGKKDTATATNSSAKHGDDEFTDSEDDGRRVARRKGGKGKKR